MKPIFEIANVFQGLARSGRGAGVRIGDWRIRLVESGDVLDDGILSLEGLRQIELARGPRTERYLLRPCDVLVTARSGAIQVALVPAGVSRTVAAVTLLVVRPQRTRIWHRPLAVVLPHLCSRPDSVGEVYDCYRHTQVPVR